MPWVRLDDRFPSHRKVSLLSDKAFRLYVSALCWSSENLTEGKILDRELSVVARVRGLKAAAAELEQAQLWERLPDGWQIHDFLEYNPDRAKIQAERASNAARQQAFRDRKKEARDAARNAVTDGVPEQQNDAAATATRHEGDTKARESGGANQSSSQVSKFRNAVSNGTPCPSPARSTSYGSTASSEPDRSGGVPDILLPLRTALAAAGLSAVAWDIKKFTEWERIRRQVERVGVDVMVRSAVTAASNRGEPDNVTAWIGRWESLPDPAPKQRTSPPRDPKAGWPPHCGHTDCDVITRTRDAEDAKGIRSSVPCHLCHPTRKEPAA